MDHTGLYISIGFMEIAVGVLVGDRSVYLRWLLYVSGGINVLSGSLGSIGWLLSRW